MGFKQYTENCRTCQVKKDNIRLIFLMLTINGNMLYSANLKGYDIKK